MLGIDFEYLKHCDSSIIVKVFMLMLMIIASLQYSKHSPDPNPDSGHLRDNIVTHT